jgi:hypothetical protein
MTTGNPIARQHKKPHVNVLAPFSVVFSSTVIFCSVWLKGCVGDSFCSENARMKSGRWSGRWSGRATRAAQITRRESIGVCIHTLSHTEQKMTVDENTTNKRANVFTWGFFGALALGFPAAIYVSDWSGLTPKANKPGPASPLRKD